MRRNAIFISLTFITPLSKTIITIALKKKVYHGNSEYFHHLLHWSVVSRSSLDSWCCSEAMSSTFHHVQHAALPGHLWGTIIQSLLQMQTMWDTPNSWSWPVTLLARCGGALTVSWKPSTFHEQKVDRLLVDLEANDGLYDVSEVRRCSDLAIYKKHCADWWGLSSTKMNPRDHVDLGVLLTLPFLATKSFSNHFCARWSDTQYWTER